MAEILDPYAHAPHLDASGELDPRSFFLNPDGSSAAAQSEPVELEIGPGRGWFTLERLEADPNTRVVGLEIKKKWATIVDDRLKKRGLAHRGRVFAEDARLVVPRFVPACLKIAYFHFPDPWWKKRHEKRLVVGEILLPALARALVPGGELFIQTDVFERAEQYEAEVAQFPEFEALMDSPRVDDHPFIARSPRERIALRDGIPVARLRYRRKHDL